MSNSLVSQINVIITRVICNTLGNITEDDKRVLKNLTKLQDLVDGGKYENARDWICFMRFGVFEPTLESEIASKLEKVSLCLKALLDSRVEWETKEKDYW